MSLKRAGERGTITCIEKRVLLFAFADKCFIMFILHAASSALLNNIQWSVNRTVERIHYIDLLYGYRISLFTALCAP